MTIPSSIIVSSQQGLMRLDRYLVCQGLNISRNRIQHLIGSGMVKVNDQQVSSSYLVKPGDLVGINLEAVPIRRARPEAEKIPLDIVFEDQYLIVINKPAGMVVHPAAGNYQGTLVNALIHHSNQLSNISGSERPGILHRLDKDTSGLLLIAKTNQAHSRLAAQLEARKITRRYQALVWGLVGQAENTINAAIGRSAFDRKKMDVTVIRGHDAVTHYKVLKEYKIISHLELRLETGRTHQIRVHLKYLGHPVVGDLTYGGAGKLVVANFARKNERIAEQALEIMKRQALHAAILGFKHPVSGEYLEFASQVPDDMSALLKLLGTITP